MIKVLRDYSLAFKRRQGEAHASKTRIINCLTVAKLIRQII
jgi:hypothetical protein